MNAAQKVFRYIRKHKPGAEAVMAAHQKMSERVNSWTPENAREFLSHLGLTEEGVEEVLKEK